MPGRKGLKTKAFHMRYLPTRASLISSDEKYVLLMVLDAGRGPDVMYTEMAKTLKSFKNEGWKGSKNSSSSVYVIIWPPKPLWRSSEYYTYHVCGSQ